MKYAAVFTLLGCILAFTALTSGGPALLLLWPAVSFLVVGAAYAGLGPHVYGKRPDGRLAPGAVIVLLPYLLMTWAVWHLSRALDRSACCHEIAPGLWLGRRPFARELPPGVSLVVDLTAEFAEPRAVREGRDYHCVPSLDATAPDERSLRSAIEKVAGWPGTVYVHCAQGYGRSALFAAAVLVRRGLAADARQAEAQLRQSRPGVRLSPAQRRLLDRLTCGR
jgi:protein-tyrosine phosphatase